MPAHLSWACTTPHWLSLRNSLSWITESLPQCSITVCPSGTHIIFNRPLSSFLGAVSYSGCKRSWYPKKKSGDTTLLSWFNFLANLLSWGWSAWFMMAVEREHISLLYDILFGYLGINFFPRTSPWPCSFYLLNFLYRLFHVLSLFHICKLLRLMHVLRWTADFLNFYNALTPWTFSHPTDSKEHEYHCLEHRWYGKQSFKTSGTKHILSFVNSSGLGTGLESGWTVILCNDLRWTTEQLVVKEEVA